MAQIKFLKGNSTDIDIASTPFHDGYIYFTSNDGGLYIDTEDNGVESRIRLNPVAGSEQLLTAAGEILLTDSGEDIIAWEDTNTNTTYTLAKSGDHIILRGSDGTASIVSDSDTTYAEATSDTSGLMSAADKEKLDGISAGATADTDTTYTLTKSGNVITLTGSDGVTTSVTDSNTTYSAATTSAAGLMSAADKAKLDGIAEGATASDSDTTYTLTKSGTTITLTGSDGSTTSVTDSNTTYSAATTSAAGLMSASDKTKLDGIDTGANAYTHPTVTASNTTSTASPAHGGTFTAVDSVTRDSSGHVTGVNTKTVTLPADNNTTYSAGTGLSLSGTTFNHSNSVTAGTAKGDSSKTLSFGGTFTIPSVTYDAQGHITGAGTTTMTMPANPNTDTNTTYTLSKSGSTITLTDSSGGTSSVTDSDTTYDVATESADGLMSAEDKAAFNKYVYNHDTLATRASEVLTTDDGEEIIAYEVIASDTTYTLTKSGNVITLTGSDGSKQCVLDNDTTDFASSSIYGDDSISLGRASGTAKGEESIAFGAEVEASGAASVAVGYGTVASGRYSNAEGYYSSATASSSHAEGSNTEASGSFSHTEGYSTAASNNADHAEGYETAASGIASHAEGYSTKAQGLASHAEGSATTAQGKNSHAEGDSTTAGDADAHAEGYYTEASGWYSHAESYKTVASGTSSHAENSSTTASGVATHAEGVATTASNYASHAGGKYNSAMTTGGAETTQVGDVFVLGNGTGSGALSNAFRVTYSGAVYGLSAFNSSGADYAEFVKPWADGNPDAEDRVGYFVTLDGDYIRKAESGEYIAGITSACPSVVGASDETYYWKYERDEFGRVVWEDVTDENGNTVENGRMKIAEDYDATQEYTPRKDRPEWDYVGMLGVLAVRDDGTCVAGGWCCCGTDGIGTAADTRGYDTYYVIERVTDDVVRVLLK